MILSGRKAGAAILSCYGLIPATVGSGVVSGVGVATLGIHSAYIPCHQSLCASSASLGFSQNDTNICVSGGHLEILRETTMGQWKSLHLLWTLNKNFKLFCYKEAGLLRKGKPTFKAESVFLKIPTCEETKLLSPMRSATYNMF